MWSQDGVIFDYMILYINVCYMYVYMHICVYISERERERERVTHTHTHTHPRIPEAAADAPPTGAGRVRSGERRVGRECVG